MYNSSFHIFYLLSYNINNLLNITLFTLYCVKKNNVDFLHITILIREVVETRLLERIENRNLKKKVAKSISLRIF